jgi:hypothetical protein
MLRVSKDLVKSAFSIGRSESLSSTRDLKRMPPSALLPTAERVLLPRTTHLIQGLKDYTYNTQCISVLDRRLYPTVL